jgi:hypothetical protein
MPLPPGLQVHHNGSLSIVEPRHYDLLRDMIDKGDKGWIELDGPGGDKLFCRVEDIEYLLLMPAEAQAFYKEYPE